MTTKEPVTTSGWYELADGRVQRFGWSNGHLLGYEIVATWAAVPSTEERMDALIAADVASR